jgi:hypothetical protein
MRVLYPVVAGLSSGREEFIEFFQRFSGVIGFPLSALAEVIPQQDSMIVMVSHEVGTAPALESAEVIPVLVRRRENERFTGGFVLDAHDCGNHVGFGVDPIGGEAPDSLEEELAE